LNELAERIASEIKNRGVISFAQFMRMALYCPDFGFYEKEKDRIGRHGDFFTSVSVGKIFGELLAFQFAEWLEPAKRQNEGPYGRPPAFQLVEAGAHHGDLARDILQWLRQNRPRLFESIEYWIVEPSQGQLERQRNALAQFQGKVRWFHDLGALPPVRGVIFSNELLDAMPVHRMTWQRGGGNWMEWGVACDRGRFTWAPIPESEQAVSSLPARSWLGRLPAQLLQVVPDGFTTEISPTAEDWWSKAAGVLHWGRLMTIDYGFTTEELLAPERSKGTLRGYREHRLIDDLLASPGEQDLTAHINFSALQERGESPGLKTELFTTQSRFLSGVLSCALSSTADQLPWSAADLRQFQTLASPEHLGQSFRVLVQSRAK
jgi:SAM-dependent MidA family methyltransferase